MTITRTTARQWLTAIALGAALTGCTTTDTGTPTPTSAPDGQTTPQPSSGSQNPAPQSNGQASNGQNNAKTAITLGDLDKPVDAKSVGAPFDPCAIGWSSFPADVRPAEDRKPKLRAPGTKDGFGTACRYDNGEKIEVNLDMQSGQSSAKAGKDFIALIIWAPPGGVSANPGDHKGSTAATYSGKPGVLKSTTDSKGNPLCTAIVTLANGVGGISVTNGRFPAVDTCVIAKTVTEKIASVAP